MARSLSLLAMVAADRKQAMPSERLAGGAQHLMNSLLQRAQAFHDSTNLPAADVKNEGGGELTPFRSAKPKLLSQTALARNSNKFDN